MTSKTRALIYTGSIIPELRYADTHLSSAINYIIHNLEKHKLPTSVEFQGLIDDFIANQDEVINPEDAV